MFNQLTAPQTVAAMGHAARSVARGSGELSAFDRAQLMSAYSTSRHLAVELTAYGPLLRAYAAAVGLAPDVEAARAGELACDLLDGLRGDASPESAGRREAIRSALRELVDREVAVLAAAIEDGAKT